MDEPVLPNGGAGLHQSPALGSRRAASDWFPGLLIESVAAGGTPDVSFARAALVVAVYVSLAAAAAFTVFSHRDVTA